MDVLSIFVAASEEEIKKMDNRLVLKGSQQRTGNDALRSGVARSG
jgi:hypothetical protein